MRTDQGPDDIDRLIHQTLEELGWSADASRVAERVKRLDIGLPVEDEFSVICAWLGKCELLHKLEQHQIPKSSKKKYQVPDILAYFTTQINQLPVLIEIKSSKKNVLSFAPDYLDKLKQYADLMGMPLLIAWKYHSLWMVFEEKHLKKAVKNFNIHFGDALKENILGPLVGDFSYQIGAGAGIHLRVQKEELLETKLVGENKTESWRMRITEVVLTDREGKPANNLSPDVQSLFTAWDLEAREEHTDDHIWIRHVARGDGFQFAHAALVQLLDWSLPSGERISWRREARKEKLGTIIEFRSTVERAMNEGVVQYILDQVPHNLPDFLARPDDVQN